MRGLQLCSHRLYPPACLDLALFSAEAEEQDGQQIFALQLVEYELGCLSGTADSTGWSARVSVVSAPRPPLVFLLSSDQMGPALSLREVE